MTTDHLTPEQEAEAPLFFGDGGSGWGFGVGVVARRDDVSATPEVRVVTAHKAQHTVSKIQ